MKLPLLKHTHTQQRKIIIITKGNANLPPQGISTPTTPETKAMTATVKEQEPLTAVTKISTPEVAGILDPLHSYVSST